MRPLLALLATAMMLAGGSVLAQESALRVSAVSNQSCALGPSGTIRCWGWRSWGSPGAQAPRPEFFGIADAVAVDGSCARRAGGEVTCWDPNLATGTPPRTYPEVAGATVVSSAISTTQLLVACAVVRGGAQCWGENSQGALGDGTLASRSVPAPVLGLASGVADISAGGNHACAVTTAGAVWCWGDNSRGALGRPSQSLSLSSTPVAVSLPLAATRVLADSEQSCALLTDTSVRCWGVRNTTGPLQAPVDEWTEVPFTVAGLEHDIVSLHHGTYHQCAITSQGRALCWGWNPAGLMGDAAVPYHYLQAVTPAGLEADVVSIAGGYLHTCAALRGGNVRCFGRDDVGQLGNDTFTTLDAGRTGTLVANLGPASHEGIWWRTGGGESGWGVAIAHQADTLFATWYTYDGTGRGQWLMASNLARVAANRYTGPLARLHGPAFSTPAWNSGSVAGTTVGALTFDFTDAGNGTMTWTLDGTTRTVPVSRYVYSPTPPVCVQGALANAANHTGLWWRAGGTESGWGLDITQQGDLMFSTWFTYEADGAPLWLVMTDGRKAANADSWSGAIYRARGPSYDTATWDSNKVVLTRAGSATLTFTGDAQGQLDANVDGVLVSRPLERFGYAQPATVCR